MNPYEPPRAEASPIETGEPPVIRVRYGPLYPLSLLVSGLCCFAGWYYFHALIGSAGSLFVVSGVLNVAMAAFTIRGVYFDVFPDRVEFLSPLFPRWRRPRPLAAVKPVFLHRLIAQPGDFQRFLAFRSGSPL